MNEPLNNSSNIIIYQTEDGLTRIDVKLGDDTVWLSIDQMAELFQRNKSTISRHIKSVFEEGELNRVGGKRSSFLPTFVFRPLTPPYVPFGIRRFLFWAPFEIQIRQAWVTCPL